MIGILAVVLFFGASRVITDTYTIGYLPDRNQVVQDHNFLQEKWGNYVPLEFTIKPSGNLKANDPEVLNAMTNFEMEAQLLP